MKKNQKPSEKKDNNSYLHLEEPNHKSKAMQALAKAKALEAEKLASGKKWLRINAKTEVLR